jgi:hypothetical protein
MERLAIRNRAGDVVAWSLLDDVDFERFAGLPWHRDASGYAVHTLPREGGPQPALRLHRAILGLTRHDPLQADHINGDRMDNRRSNLRIVTLEQNGQNKRSYGRTSLHRGVSRHPGGLWLACVRAGGQRRQKYFRTELEAAEWASSTRAELMPFAVESRS